MSDNVFSLDAHRLLRGCYETIPVTLAELLCVSCRAWQREVFTAVIGVGLVCPTCVSQLADEHA